MGKGAENSPMAKADKPIAQPLDLPSDSRPAASIDTGRAAIVKALETMPGAPGVYRMLARDGEVLYVGKAKNLKNRVRNYAQPAGLNTRTLRMISETRAMEVVTTHTEVEALLLESNLIKRLRPRYNILLRDDKSFPFIVITGDHEWPQLAKHRGARNRKGEYFGPFASASSVNHTLNTLQKAFPLRSCSDSIFAARTRPCLQYQIRRCAGPCVDRIDKYSYAELVTEARDFLSGRSREVQHGLSQKMEAASAELAFETAAVYRDRLRALAHVQAHQGINVASVAEADVIAIHMEGGQSCIQVFFFRAGQNWGNRAYFPSHGREQTPGEVLGAFLGQFYDDKPPPREILLSEKPENQELIAEALSVKAERKVRLHRPERGQRRELVNHAQSNAREALARRLAESASQRRLLEAMAEHYGSAALQMVTEQFDRLVRYCHPFWQYSRDSGILGQEGKSIIGVEDEHSELIPARYRDSLQYEIKSTGFRHRIDVARIQHGLPAFLLRGMDDYRAYYEAKRKGLDPLHVIPGAALADDLFPEEKQESRRSFAGSMETSSFCRHHSATWVCT